MTYDPADNSYKCWELWIAEMKKRCIKPDGSFDRVEAERLINGRSAVDTLAMIARERGQIV